MEKVHAFLYVHCVLNSSGGREEIWRDFDKSQIKFLFLHRDLYLFGLARPDEMPNEADLLDCLVTKGAKCGKKSK